MSQGNSWILVTRHKLKKTKKPKQALRQSTPKFFNLATSTATTISIDVLQTLDELSLLVYCVLSKFGHPLPASAIKKEVNKLIVETNFPLYICDEKKAKIKKEYIKKDIGWVLYDSPLKEHVLCNQERLPRLWKLK